MMKKSYYKSWLDRLAISYRYCYLINYVGKWKKFSRNHLVYSDETILWKKFLWNIVRRTCFKHICFCFERDICFHKMNAKAITMLQIYKIRNLSRYKFNCYDLMFQFMSKNMLIAMISYVISYNKLWI